MLPSRSQDRAPSYIAAGLAAAAFIVAVIALVASATNTSGGGTAASAGTKTVEVKLSEYKITPAAITVAPGTHLVLKVTNAGTMGHNVQLQGGSKGSGLLNAGASATADLGTIEGSTEAWCTIPGHKELGMTMKIMVEGSSANTAAGSSTMTGMTGSASGITVDPNAKPSAGWKPYDPTLAPAPGGTEHKVSLHAVEKVMEVAPGVKQMMWSFNGQVPGPTLHGKVGDLFTVTLTNDGTIGHSIDFHASKTNMDTDMRTLKPGESLVYQFVAKHSGIWMYHCGTKPVLHHIGMGMYGAVVIDPRNLPAVDHEYVFVQSELYFGAKGGPATLTQMLNEQWDGVVWNGYYNQYSFAPITGVKPGETVRIWVLDTGPSENSAFHIVGTQWDTVFKEGAYLLRAGNAEQGGSQTMDLQPSQGGFVECTFDKPGTYAMVTHKFASASKGAVAVWKVGDAPTMTGG